MIRTKGSGRASGRVIGRAQGREVSHDADEAHQWQRPTTSTRRQREATYVVKEVQHVNHVDDEVLKFGRSTLEIEGLVAATRLSPMIACLLDTGDRGLMSTFVERWHKETSSFHLSVEEVTITLGDVASLLHFPITCVFHDFEPLHVDDCWIFEHFPSVGSTIAAKDYDERKPCSCHWKSRKELPILTHCKHLDRLTSDVVCWILYGDHRAFREFETIPPHHASPSLCIEDINDRWIQFSEYIAPVGQICVVPGQCSPDNMEWFYLISHPLMSPAHHWDPPRHPSM
ncbi:hypothetical protein GmHk_09G025781 [Glycine max]|nr:hypothetical protein GmHk_09G025781 [Glycine max]